MFGLRQKIFYTIHLWKWYSYVSESEEMKRIIGFYCTNTRTIWGIFFYFLLLYRKNEFLKFLSYLQQKKFFFEDIFFQIEIHKWRNFLRHKFFIFYYMEDTTIHIWDNYFFKMIMDCHKRYLQIMLGSIDLP